VKSFGAIYNALVLAEAAGSMSFSAQARRGAAPVIAPWVTLCNALRCCADDREVVRSGVDLAWHLHRVGMLPDGDVHTVRLLRGSRDAVRHPLASDDCHERTAC
jgi:hypothetical protein